MAQLTGGLHNMRISDDLLSDNVHSSLLSPGRKNPLYHAARNGKHLGSDGAVNYTMHDSLSADQDLASDLATVREALTAAEPLEPSTGHLLEKSHEKKRIRYSMEQLLMLQDKCTAEPAGTQWQIAQADKHAAPCTRHTAWLAYMEVRTSICDLQWFIQCH